MLFDVFCFSIYNFFYCHAICFLKRAHICFRGLLLNRKLILIQMHKHCLCFVLMNAFTCTFVSLSFSYKIELCCVVNRWSKPCYRETEEKKKTWNINKQLNKTMKAMGLVNYTICLSVELSKFCTYVAVHIEFEIRFVWGQFIVAIHSRLSRLSASTWHSMATI